MSGFKQLKGLNLGCFLEYKDTFEKKVNIDKIIKSLKSKDMNCIRLLISTELFKGNYYKQILFDTIKSITQQKIYCIITIGGHELWSNDSWISFKKMLASEEAKYDIILKIADFWQNLALNFREDYEYLIFEPFNEIHDGMWGHGFNLFDNGKSYEIINMINNAVRESIGLHLKKASFIVKPYCQQLEMIKYLDREVVKHSDFIGAAYYGANYRFTISAEEPIFNISAENDFYKKVYKPVKNKKLLLTEIGCNTKNLKKENIDLYFDFLNKNVLNKKTSYLIWDDGDNFKYIDRIIGEWLIDF